MKKTKKKRRVILQASDQDVGEDAKSQHIELFLDEDKVNWTKVQLAQMLPDGAWKETKMGWAHWQPNEEFIDIWFKSMQAEAKNTAKNKATQTEELGETQGWLASVASKPELSKQYELSIATSFQCPKRNQGQEEVLQTCLQNAPERVKEEEEVSSKQAPAQEEKEPGVCAKPNLFLYGTFSRHAWRILL